MLYRRWLSVGLLSWSLVGCGADPVARQNAPPVQDAPPVHTPIRGTPQAPPPPDGQPQGAPPSNGMPPQPVNPPLGTAPMDGGADISGQMTGGSYTAVSDRPQGALQTGQAASIVLSDFGFGQSGGALSFNHPAGINSDGERLFLADRGNNRILIWNTLPDSNQAPDVVLGQPDMQSNLAGDGLDGLNWPSVVMSDGVRLFVADTNNNRVLVWETMPTQNGQAADYAITDQKLDWPWGMWTDGTRLVVSSTRQGMVLMWNTIPRGAQTPDVVLTAGGKFGTPRTITSNGKFLMIGDHNARDEASANGQGAFVWNQFPTSDTPYDFVLTDPIDGHAAWLQGAINDQGTLVALGATVHVWNQPPTAATTRPDVTLATKLTGGDGADVALAGGKVYVSLYNGGRVLIYDAIPTTGDAQPIAALGSDAVDMNPMQPAYLLNNPQPYTDGKHLVVVSDFDRTMHVYTSIPDQSHATPDVVYRLPEATWDGELYDGTLLLAGHALYVWKQLPLKGEAPDVAIRRTADLEFTDVRGIAYDGTYTYVSDTNRDRVMVYDGIPNEASTAVAMLPVIRPTRLSSDGEYVVAASTEGGNGGFVTVWRTADVLTNPQGQVVGNSPQIRMNLPQHALVANGALWIGDTGFYRVQMWQSIASALAGNAPDVVLGAPAVDVIPVAPVNGQDTLYWPATLAYDGSFLWVGEFKFSHRLLRFDVQ